MSNSLQPHGLQPARILSPWDSSGKNTGWVAISYPNVSSCPRGRICISCIGQRILYSLATGEVPGHGGHWLPRKGVFCVPDPLCQYIERFYTGTSNYVLGSKQSWNTAHWQTGECHRVYHNFTHDKTKNLYEYKQWHKIKDYIPKVLVLLFVELGLVNFISNLKMHFAYFIVKLLIYSFPGSSVFLREPSPLLYVPSVAAAAAKSLQSCPTLWDPIDGSPPGSPVPGILQARTLEWVAFSFSDAWKWKVKVKSLSRVRLLVGLQLDCSLPGSSIHGIFQARVLEWGAIVFSGSFCYFLLKNQ